MIATLFLVHCEIHLVELVLLRRSHNRKGVSCVIARGTARNVFSRYVVMFR